MSNSDRPFTQTDTQTNQSALPNREWELSELVQIITAELDQAQDILILRSQSRRLSMMVNQLSLDLQVDVRCDPNGHVMFRTAPPGQPGATVLKLGFTPALDTQVQETRKSVDLNTDQYRPLETLSEIQAIEIQKLKTVGIQSVNDLEAATQTPAMLTEVSSKTGLDESRLRLWRQLPFITQITPESGPPGSVVVIDGGNLDGGSIEVSFQDRIAKVLERTSTRLTVEMPKSAAGSGLVVAKIQDQRTNTRPWSAKVVDLCVQDIFLEPSALRVGNEVTCQGSLINQGSLDVARFMVKWELFQVGSGGAPDSSSSESIRPQIPDDVPDDMPRPTRLIQQVSYSHGVLLSQQQSTDGAIAFKFRVDQAGDYRIRFTADPENQVLDHSPTNNSFTREFWVGSGGKPIPDLPES